MTDQQKNQAIADKCPGRFKYIPAYDGFRPEGWYFGYEEQWARCLYGSIIDDLNAMAVAWDCCIKGNEELEDEFSVELLRACDDEYQPDGDRPNGSDASWAVASNATSRQRADAFAKVFGLW